MTDRPSTRVRHVLLCTVLAFFAAAPSLALTPRQEANRFDDKRKTRPGGVVAVEAVGVRDLSATDTLRMAWESFLSDQDGAWSVWLEERSGLPTLAAGRGIPWTAGRGNDLPAGPPTTIERLEQLARGFLEQHGDLLGRWSGQMVLDREASGRLGPNGWQVVFRQVIDEVPVDGARYDFQVSHGNLVAFGATRWSRVRTRVEPTLAAAEARHALDEYLGVDTANGLTELEPLSLHLIPVDPNGDDASAWGGLRGRGIDHRLVWRFRMNEPGLPPTWVAEVDAHTGEIVSFYDDTHYDRVEGGVYPVTNTNDPGDASSLEQPLHPMPHTNYSEDGGPTQYTNDFGLYECMTQGAPIRTTLDGLFFRVNDNCGAISETTTCDDELDLEDSGGGTNCTVPAGHSAGDTAASRASYYHLNRIRDTAKFWLPNRPWLDSQVADNVNISSTCNAFWNGSVNFYRRGGGCRNTGEIQGVITHEWGHGMDFNDGGGGDNPSEAYADVVAIFQARESCVGRGFFESGTCSGYGDTCETCTGIRDMDWDARQAHTPATPANFTQPNCGNGSGPCGRAVHCESYVPSESMYDLATRDLPAAGLDAETSWQVAERLFYLSREGSGGDAINCSLPNSDGCGTNTWFHKLRVADDDDGDLSNGTPNAAAIFAAFDRHAVACGNASDADNQSSGSCPTLQKPVVTTRELTNSVELSWGADPNAASYYVLRTELGCDRSQTPIAQVGATTHTDDGIANDFTVYYRVQPVSAGDACVGPVSDCIAATPQANAGTVRFLSATFGCGNAITLRVRDANVGAATVTVDVWSDSEPTPETVVLTETAPGSGKYLGEIMSTSDPAVNGDGLLSLTDGDAMFAEYIDADDGAGGTNVVQQHTATADCIFPVISDVHEQNVGLSSATIVWTTNELSDTTVQWGETTPPGNTSTGDNRTTDHRVTLNGLAECTVYYYQVESSDPAGNVALDDNGGNFFRFETKGDFGNGPQACHAGEVTVQAPVYSCSDTVSFEVVDIDLNLDPGVADTVTLSVTSSTETVAELVLATETAPNSSVFTGSIATAQGAPVTDGVLQTSDGDVITVTYQDADDGGGFPAISFDTASADCAGPAITNLRVDTITNARATIRWDTQENADTVVEWGNTPALGQVASSGTMTTVHALTISQFQICSTFYFRVSSTDTHGNTTVFDNGGQPFRFHSFDIPGLFFLDDFESGAAGWELEGEWEVGAPEGLGGSSGPADPTVAYNNDQVLGHDLSGQGGAAGDYEPLIAESAFSPELDGSTWTNTRLIYHRRLNAGSGDTASAWLYTNGTGRPLFNTGGDPQSETSFQTVALDIGLFADGANTVQVEFFQSADGSGQHSGWNLDDFILKDGSQPDYAPCVDCSAAPSFGGATSAVDNDACGANGVTVNWEQAVAWGSGDPGTYAIYRDTVPNFTPSAANLVASGVTGLSYNDTTAPNDLQLHYLARAENAESCGVGPNNGGLTDDNSSYVQVSETTSQSVPTEVSNLRANLINKAHVRLSWDGIAGATSYRIYRADSPQGPFQQIAEIGGTSYEDLNQGGNANTYYYEVTAVNACGDEGP